MDPTPARAPASREDVLLLLSSVTADLDIVRRRAARRLPTGNPETQIANQLRLLNTHTDAFTQSVNRILFAVADALEENNT